MKSNLRATGLEWASAVVLLTGWVPAACGQQYVVQDRLAQARERVQASGEEGESEVVQPAVVAPVSVRQPVPQVTETSVVEMQVLHPGEASSPGAHVRIPAQDPVVSQYPAEQFFEDTSWGPGAYGPWGAGDPGIPATVCFGDGGGRAGKLEPGPYDYSWRRSASRTVLTNTHWYSGIRGFGQPVPFAYSSAYCRSGSGQMTDAAGHPLQCDEWKTACGCNCCDEPLGLDMFKSRPWGPLPQKKHQCSRRCQCTGCEQEGCGVSAGSCPTCR